MSSLDKEMLPFIYQNSIEGIKNVLNESWRIYNIDVEKSQELSWLNRLNVLKLVKECHESLFKPVSEVHSLVYMRTLETRLEKMETDGSKEK